MKIEEGKFYRTRDGLKVGPMFRSDGGNEAYYWRASEFSLPAGKTSAWYEDGMFYDFMEDPADIVAEWDSGPVRIVTHKEIVPGVYDHVQIVRVYDDGVNVFMNEGKWSASDLRAAAELFTQVADALDSQP